MTLTRLAFFKDGFISLTALGLMMVIMGGSLLIWLAVPVVPPYAPAVVYEYPGTISPSSLTPNQLIIGSGSAPCGGAITGTLPVGGGPSDTGCFSLRDGDCYAPKPRRRP